MVLLERRSIANSGIVADPLVQALLLRLPLSIQRRGWPACGKSASRKRWCAPAQCCNSMQPKHWYPSVAAATAVRPRQVDHFRTKRHNSLGRDRFLTIILAEPKRAAALSGDRDIRLRLHRYGSARAALAHMQEAPIPAAKQALDAARTSIKRNDVLFSQQTSYGWRR